MTENKHLPFLKNIAFSDYGVTKFTDSEIDFSKVGGRILPKVKYTTKESYLVYKGKRDWDKGDWIVSARDMAKTVVASKNFYGKDFSYGDNEIYNISASSTRLGSNQDWVAYCANHHIAVVVDELSNLAESLGLS